MYLFLPWESAVMNSIGYSGLYRRSIAGLQFERNKKENFAWERKKEIHLSAYRILQVSLFAFFPDFEGRRHGNNHTEGFPEMLRVADWISGQFRHCSHSFPELIDLLLWDNFNYQCKGQTEQMELLNLWDIFGGPQLKSCFPFPTSQAQPSFQCFLSTNMQMWCCSSATKVKSSLLLSIHPGYLVMFDTETVSSKVDLICLNQLIKSFTSCFVTFPLFSSMGF